jgi:hypothetical protein
MAAAGNAARISVAPVRMTAWGSTDGAAAGSFCRSVLRKADCAAEMLSEPPRVWATAGWLVREWLGGRRQKER